MSDIPAEMNLRDVLARIDRQQAETRKFVAEQQKLMTEADELRAEERKLVAIGFWHRGSRLSV